MQFWKLMLFEVVFEQQKNLDIIYCPVRNSSSIDISSRTI